MWLFKNLDFQGAGGAGVQEGVLFVPAGGDSKLRPHDFGGSRLLAGSAKLMNSNARKRVVEDLLALDCDLMIRAGAFRAPLGTPCRCTWTDPTGEEVLRVTFWVEGETEPTALRLTHESDVSTSPRVAHTIKLVGVPCHLGGKRVVFRCPGEGAFRPCGRQVRKLYLVDGRWLCRECGSLTHAARQRHNPRIDALVKEIALGLAVQSDDRRRRFLGLSAYARALEQLRRYRQ